jgi:hypothetical protein
MFWLAFMGALLLGTISIVALVLRFRRAGAVQRQQITWFAYGGRGSLLARAPQATAPRVHQGSHRNRNQRARRRYSSR